MSNSISDSLYMEIKESIKKWIINVNSSEKIDDDIIALNFGLFEPYGIELIGSKEYDEEDDDWACDEDFVPEIESCPNINISEDEDWKDVLDIMVKILKELVSELGDIDIFQNRNITTGFDDGDLIKIK